ncbi:hypothetical protein AGMMS49992_24040 [Clostridia bacterium]|nr:hypothetical protein AGMMS49992_24040 [Clostridia bacterium]
MGFSDWIESDEFSIEGMGTGDIKGGVYINLRQERHKARRELQKARRRLSRAELDSTNAWGASDPTAHAAVHSMVEQHRQDKKTGQRKAQIMEV